MGAGAGALRAVFGGGVVRETEETLRESRSLRGSRGVVEERVDDVGERLEILGAVEGGEMGGERARLLRGGAAGVGEAEAVADAARAADDVADAGLERAEGRVETADAVAEVVHARQEGGLLILRLARERRQTTRRRVREGVQVLLGGFELVQERHRRREDVPSGGRRGRRVEGHDRGEVRVEVEGVILKRDGMTESVSGVPTSRDDDFE